MYVSRVSNRCRGFTLVEVMISIAIALVLILGISQIFSLAQRTTGAGAQVLSAAETSRGIQAMFQSDVESIDDTSDAPGIAIISYPEAAFRNRVDLQQDNDGDPTTVNDPTNPGQPISAGAPWQINDRIHRVDVLCFFARGRYARRTGQVPASPTAYDPSCLVSPTTTREAFIWLGHLALPDNTALKSWTGAQPGPPAAGGNLWPAPGEGTLASNPNNFFASDWILGRQVILLTPAPTSGNWENHLLGFSNGTYDPLVLGNTRGHPEAHSTPDVSQLYASQCDLADATIATYTQFMKTQNYLSWWESVSGGISSNPTGTMATAGSLQQQIRYYGNPFVQKPAAGAANPMQTLGAAVAQASPIFVRGCTQFIVEFAGDFVTQDASGNVGLVNANGQTTSGGPDGEIDYVVDPNTHAHLIRWYGFPRDTAGTGTTTQFPQPPLGVVPLGTLLNPSAPTPVEFERTTPPSTSVGWTKNGVSTNGLPAVYATPYVCAWDQFTDAAGIPRPKMLRITVGVDDPTGHLNTQQLFEYIINLPN